MTARSLLEPARELPIEHNVDVLVLGGGPSGIAAALAAARGGARTLLVERYGFLGGMGTAAMVTNFCGLFADVGGVVQQVVHGVADDILARIQALDALNRPQSKGATTVISYDNAAYKCVADQLLLEAGVQLRLHTFAVGAIMNGRSIAALVVESKSGRVALAARTFIDCSGDADLAAWAGAPFEKGRDDGYLAYPTMMFRLGGVDTEAAERDGLPIIRKYAAEARARGELGFLRSSPIAAPQAHAGEWRMNMTQVSLDGRPVDGTNVEHLTRAEIIGRQQALQATQYLRSGVPGFEKCYVLEIAPQVGIRETRRIVGEYVLTDADVSGARDFPDGIGCTGWPMEKHVLGGIEWTFVGGRGYYQLPFRALVPRGVENLLVAGRCLSANQEAQASARVSGPCFVMGQAAGTAAALSVKVGCRAAEVDHQQLRAALVAQNVFLGRETSLAPAKV